MKLFTGCVVSAGLVLSSAAANAQGLVTQGLVTQGLVTQGTVTQGLAPHEIGKPAYTVVSDVGGPYAAMPPEVPAPRYGPRLLPPQEVYTVVRESGFSPLGIPQQRGLVYTISVIDRGGDDGRLVIDARTGRIIRFMPAYRMGDNFNQELAAIYGPVGPPPPISSVRGPPRPPAPIPHVASRTPSVPTPKPSPTRAGDVRPLAAKPVAAAVQAKPADAQAAAPAVVEAKPAPPPIQPTQEMPKVQGLE
jgi:hypothetical protein